MIQVFDPVIKKFIKPYADMPPATSSKIVRTTTIGFVNLPMIDFAKWPSSQLTFPLKSKTLSNPDCRKTIAQKQAMDAGIIKLMSCKIFMVGFLSGLLVQVFYSFG